MKKLAIILYLIALVPICTVAQEFSVNMWHVGEIDLTSGETKRGKIKYSLEEEQVLLIVGNKLHSYSTNKVESFLIKDALSNESRLFFSIPHSLNNNYKRNHFFELLSDGQVSLLSRQEIVLRRVRRDVTNDFIFRNPNYPVPMESENYFLMDAQGNISACGNTNKEVIEYFSDHSAQIKSFIKANKLDVNFRYDMIHVVEYYNSLKVKK